MVVSRPALYVVAMRVCWSAHPNRRSGALVRCGLTFSTLFRPRPFRTGPVPLFRASLAVSY